VVTAATFIIYAVLDGNLTAAKAYTALSLFQILRFPLLVVPMMITRLMDIIVVNGRLTRFLKYQPRNVVPLDNDSSFDPFTPPVPGAPPARPAAELQIPGHYCDVRPAGQGGFAIEISGATFKWPEPKAEEDPKKGADGKKSGRAKGKQNAVSPVEGGSSTQPLVAGQPSSSDATVASGDEPTALPPTLVEIDVRIPHGTLVGIAGPVGSGKSSLLAAIVGDMPRLAGRVVTRGSFALCTQEPWIQNCSLRENILFGAAYDPAFYARCVSACALEADMTTLPAGDQTEIGERGVNLSGGQKARVALCRACYARANVVLLDDVLSAVDAEVGAHLMSQCVGGLLREVGATVVLVTHHTHFMVDCNHVVQLNESGTIRAQGPPSTIDGLLRTSHKASRDASVANDLSALGTDTPSESQGAKSTQPKPGAQPPPAARSASKGKITSEEERERGAVNKSVWLRYAAALGWFNVMVWLIGMYGLSQGLQYGSSYWLGLWAQDKFPNLSHGGPWFYLAVYCGMASASAVAILCRSIVTAFCSVAAGRKIYNGALHAVLGSPMSFFDTTPLGRILNRFSVDAQKIDVQLASSGSQFVGYIVSLLCTILIISLVSPFVLIALPPLAFFYVLYASYYRNTAREVQRLDSISKSPIYTAFTEALNGATSIQAYGANERFASVNRAKVDFNQRAQYVSLAANRWLTVRLEFFSNLLVAATAVLAVVNSLVGSSAAGQRANLAGLALTYAPGLTDTLNFLIRQFTQLETMMVSVERMLSYSGLVAEKAVTASPPQLVAPEWPSNGAIEFRDVCMRYRDHLPDVLKGCSVRIGGGEKMGIVGRTGAGKSSILVALFRMSELRGGSILIDGVDIAAVELPTLRGRLAIIPQDPVLFTGTLRSNIDPNPAKSYEDADLWDVLRQCGMETSMAEHPKGLERPMEERGGNLSMGQRQLLCLARALLRRSRVLVLDEATASVDMESDALIQRTLQNELSGTTVLTIAHRLDTIMHCDRIMVMHEGAVAESGPPATLKNQAGSRFAELWQAQQQS